MTYSIIFEDSLIVFKQASLPSAHTAIHLTCGSLAPNFWVYKTFNKGSRQGKASGNPIPPIAAVTTSFTAKLFSLISYLLKHLIT